MISGRYGWPRLSAIRAGTYKLKELYMKILEIDGWTRRPGAPANWDPDKQGVCNALPIVDHEVDGANYMTSAWMMSNADIAAHSQGAPLYLSVSGRVHPVVKLFVGEKPKDIPIQTIALSLATELAKQIEARIQAHAVNNPSKRLAVSPLQHAASGSYIEYATLSDGELLPKDCSAWKVYGPFAVAAPRGGQSKA